MFPSQAPQVYTFNVAHDPAADQTYPLFQVPPGQQFTITGARACCADVVAASTANYFTLALQNGGTAGTGTTAVAAAIGGTIGWASLVWKPFTVSADQLDAGESLNLAYDETGTGTFGVVNVQVEGVWGEA